MKVLFVCTENRIRSATAEVVFSRCEGLEVKSAGTAVDARVRVTKALIIWSELILTMESEHTQVILREFSEAAREKRIICLHIPDDFAIMEPSLIELLKVRVRAVQSVG